LLLYFLLLTFRMTSVVFNLSKLECTLRGQSWSEQLGTLVGLRCLGYKVFVDDLEHQYVIKIEMYLKTRWPSPPVITCRQCNTEPFHFAISEHWLTLADSMPYTFALCHDNTRIPTISLNEMKVCAKCKTLNLSTDGRIFNFYHGHLIVKHC
jgi:hypothetical protein